MWLDLVQQAKGGEAPIEVNWKPFSLDQVNQKVGDDYTVWSEPEENIPDRVWGLRAGVAAGRQGRFPQLLAAILVKRPEAVVVRRRDKNQSSRGHNRAAQIGRARRRNPLCRQLVKLAQRHAPAVLALVHIDSG